ncbi:MAG: FAD-dependent oxidoreductase [Hungatella hathewayi]
MKKSMKKIIAAALTAAMMVSMAGCSKKADTAMTETTTAAQTETESQGEALYTPGTYTSEQQGNGGLIPVTVEFSETEILSVTIGENKETAGLADPALTRIPEEIVAGQTLNVDAVSGATITSEAVLAAVADCVAQAGGDVEALKGKEAAAKTAGEDIEKTADVVVIGGGGAGLAAAVSASANGTSVILIEKGSALGGNTLRAGGAYNGG